MNVMAEKTITQNITEKATSRLLKLEEEKQHIIHETMDAVLKLFKEAAEHYTDLVTANVKHIWQDARYTEVLQVLGLSDVCGDRIATAEKTRDQITNFTLAIHDLLETKPPGGTVWRRNILHAKFNEYTKQQIDATAFLALLAQLVSQGILTMDKLGYVKLAAIVKTAPAPGLAAPSQSSPEPRGKDSRYNPREGSYAALVLDVLKDGQAQHRDAIGKAVKPLVGKGYTVGSLGQAINKLSTERMIKKAGKGQRGFWMLS